MNIAQIMLAELHERGNEELILYGLGSAALNGLKYLAMGLGTLIFGAACVFSMFTPS